ncbi:MAG: hypothetical protein K6G12_07090 [Lachnospiraceae bacterium]|nr:hypothetical protein [Lachnospiraceae bacterium]
MNLFLLASALVVSLIIAIATRRTKNTYAQSEQEFWEKEHAANSVRRKPLDDLNYLAIPLDTLPISLHTDNNTIASCIDTIVELSKSPVVNLTGISNTDLKLKYGAPNITLLTLYDQRYTLLAQTLQKWANELISIGDTNAAREVLEYAVSTQTDVSGTYKCLASIYSDMGDTDSIRALLPVAETLNTPLKASIIDSLNSYLK